MNLQTEVNKVLTARLNILEDSVQRLSKAVERLSHCMATGGVGGAGSGKAGKFLSIDEQAEMYLSTRLSAEQLAILRTGKRDESTSKLRGQVVCDLYKNGISANRIAHLLNKDHNCIFYHLAMNGMVSPKNHKQVRHRIATRQARLKRRQRLALMS